MIDKFSWLSCMSLGAILGISTFGSIELISWLLFRDFTIPFPLWASILLSTSVFILSTLHERYTSTYSVNEWIDRK